MFQKRIITGSFTNNRPKTEFPKGTKFIRDVSVWTVVEEVKDTVENWRRLVADDGTEEVVSMTTLKKDLDAGTITFL